MTTCVSLASTGQAQELLDMNTKVSLMLIPRIEKLVTDPSIIQALREQNEKHQSLTHKKILKLDNEWRKQMHARRRPMVDAILSKPVSLMLSEYKKQQNGTFTDIFVFDRFGLNVAQSNPTTDYWQGDETKFLDSFGVGSGAVSIGPLEYDDSTQTYQIQVSLTIDDPETLKPIGAITFGVDVDAF